MPKYINGKNMDKMFPFEFFNEINDKLQGYVIINPAFILQDTTLTDKAKELIFKNAKDNKATKQMQENNIIQIEPLGELLIVELCTENKNIETMLNDTKNRSQVPISMLVVQLYDSANLPVFSEDVNQESIDKIPEVLWDDPNLLIAIATMSNNIDESSKLAILQIPEEIESKIFENIE